MLGSITPLGERGRGQSYAWTMASFLFGSVVAGTGLGAALGGLGRLSGAQTTMGLSLLAALLAVGLALDLGVLRARLPSVRRQVDETWLNSYRGWVYGAGFGFQLGLGVVTIVTTSAVYVALGAAFLSGSLLAGGAIGAAFGLTRWACAALGGVVRTPADLARVGDALARLDRPVRRLALAGQLVALAAVVGILLI